MVVGVLATLDLGAAYLPLDPTYPIERLGFMVDDAGIAVLLATGGTAVELGRSDITVIDPGSPNGDTPGPARVEHDPADLAYLIYTSGSTGLPKGVMLEHREVTNFFAAMDEVIDPDPPGVWLAVTSLSFDISVLELLWTVTRGFHVVLKSDRGVPAAGAAAVAGAAPTAARPVTFSLFYFAAGEEAAHDGYRLLLDSARFADRHGFEAVWTPERHFHAFGGAYPNPSVTGAALAAITEHVGIRAGSVVLPLHSPIRVAEEWGVVDNISPRPGGHLLRRRLAAQRLRAQPDGVRHRQGRPAAQHRARPAAVARRDRVHARPRRRARRRAHAPPPDPARAAGVADVGWFAGDVRARPGSSASTC